MGGTQTRSQVSPAGELCWGLRTVPLGSDLKEKPSGAWLKDPRLQSVWRSPGHGSRVAHLPGPQFPQL